MMPAAITLPTAAPAFAMSSNAASATCASAGFGQQLDRDLRDHREQAFAARDEGQQIVARRIERVGAEFDDVAGDEHRAHLAHVVHGESVFQAMHAAGVLRDVAADRARDLRRRIGRIKQPVRGGRLRDREVAHARLDDGRSRERIDRDDATKLRERQHDAIHGRQCAAGQARSRATRDHRHARRVTKRKDRDDLRLVLGQHDRARLLAIQREAVALVRARVLGRRQQRRGRHEGGQRRSERRIEHGCRPFAGFAWAVDGLFHIARESPC